MLSLYLWCEATTASEREQTINQSYIHGQLPSSGRETLRCGQFQISNQLVVSLPRFPATYWIHTGIADGLLQSLPTVAVQQHGERQRTTRVRNSEPPTYTPAAGLWCAVRYGTSSYSHRLSPLTLAAGSQQPKSGAVRHQFPNSFSFF